jgi:hypothetical protein
MLIFQCALKVTWKFEFFHRWAAAEKPFIYWFLWAERLERPLKRSLEPGFQHGNGHTW